MGGIEELTRALAGKLLDANDTVEVLTNRWPAALAAEEDVEGLHVRRIPMPAPRASLTAMLRYPYEARQVQETLSDLADSFQPQIIHAVGASWQAYHAYRLARERRLPFVLNLQGETVMDDNQIYRRSTLLRKALRAMAKGSSMVTACSRWALERSAELAPELRRGEVIPNGVAVREFRALGSPPRGGYVLAYGRLVPNKGFDLLIRAWSRVPEVRLCIAGEGPMSEDLRRLAMPFADRIRFLGRLDRKGVRRALKGSSAVVMPSRLEPFGIVALEAMAAGRPVVASNIGGAPEFLAGGYLVDPNDEEALADAVRQALAHPELGVEGKRAAAAYDWNVLAQRWRDAYSRMLRQQAA